jgi:hypothetical protein
MFVKRNYIKTRVIVPRQILQMSLGMQRLIKVELNYKCEKLFTEKHILSFFNQKQSLKIKTFKLQENLFE